MNPPLEFRRPFALPADFHRLGLRRGECSSIAIRDATQIAVHRLADASAEQPTETVDRQLGQLAASAYRLLDPRYRLQLYERVQLSYAIDRDEVKPTLGQNALLTVPEESIELGHVGDKDEDNVGYSMNDPSLENAREVVRWIRHSEEKQRRSRSKWAGHVLLSLKAWLLNRTS